MSPNKLFLALSRLYGAVVNQAYTDQVAIEETLRNTREQLYFAQREIEFLRQARTFDTKLFNETTETSNKVIKALRDRIERLADQEQELLVLADKEKQRADLAERALLLTQEQRLAQSEKNGWGGFDAQTEADHIKRDAAKVMQKEKPCST